MNLQAKKLNDAELETVSGGDGSNVLASVPIALFMNTHAAYLGLLVGACLGSVGFITYKIGSCVAKKCSGK